MRFKVFLKNIFAVSIIGGMFLSSSCQLIQTNQPSQTNQTNQSTAQSQKFPQLSGEIADGEEIAVMTTNMGVIKLRFFPEHAPLAVENFITHAKNGYYDGVIFHRVLNDFMIQTGDPTGTGMGGESIWGGTFGYEYSGELHHIRGALAMAKSALPDSNGSQFYIVQNTSFGKSDREKAFLQGLIDDGNENAISFATGNLIIGSDGKPMKISEVWPKEFLEAYMEHGGSIHLDFEHTVFGHVIEGMDVVDAIAAVNVNKSGQPAEPVVIESIVIETYSK